MRIIVHRWAPALLPTPGGQVQGEFWIGAKRRAQNVIEYGIIIATIAVVVLLGVTAFGNQITPWFRQLAGHITTVGT